MTKNLKLHNKIYESPLNQRLISEEFLKVSESILSEIINGKRIPTLDQKEILAKTLQCEVSDIFESSE